MSLTALLRQPGPAREWFEQNLPHTRKPAAMLNRQLHRGRLECAIPPLAGVRHGHVGTAADLLVRFSLNPGRESFDSVFSGAGRLSGNRSTSAAWNVAQEAFSRAAAATLDRQDRWELCLMCLVLAVFEQAYRVPAQVLHGMTNDLARLETVEQYADAMVPPACLADLLRLGPEAVKMMKLLREAEQLELGPSFELSNALGGADADLIADGTLIDMKATMQRGIVGRMELWQLAGYTLADTYDRYQIDAVAVAALRWRNIAAMPVNELLDALSGSQASDIQDMRESFQAMTRKLPARGAARRRLARRSRKPEDYFASRPTGT